MSSVPEAVREPRVRPARKPRFGLVPRIKLLFWPLLLAPFAFLVRNAFTGGLGANPVEFITLETGFWSLTLLMVTLAITPLRRLTGWNQLVQFRRLFGLFAFFYVVLHFLTYITFDHMFNLASIGEDILKRPYITVGFAAFLLLIPLAITSTKGWIRRLGKRWQLLHRGIYFAASFAVLHFFWKKSSKNDVREPLIFAAILAVLLLSRVVLQRMRARRPAPGAKSA